MVVYQALKRILGDASIATVPDESEYVEEQLERKQWEKEHQEERKRNPPSLTHPFSSEGRFYNFDDSDFENTVCIATSLRPPISHGLLTTTSYCAFQSPHDELIPPLFSQNSEVSKLGVSCLFLVLISPSFYHVYNRNCDGQPNRSTQTRCFRSSRPTTATLDGGAVPLCSSPSALLSG